MKPVIKLRNQVIRHNGHTMRVKNTSYHNYGTCIKTATLICNVCGLTACADLVDGHWRKWIGEAEKTHCGIMVAMDVMDQ